MTIRKILIGCLSLTLLTACNKEVHELAPPTQTGAGTFGAKINGELWAPKGFGPFPGDNLLEARVIAPSYLKINARNFASSPNETEFEILLTDVTGPGTYLLNHDVARPSFVENYGYFVKRNFSPQNEWLTSSAYTGTVTITRFDLVNNVVAGTFEFNALNIYNAPEPISVTEGRFDVKLSN